MIKNIIKTSLFNIINKTYFTNDFKKMISNTKSKTLLHQYLKFIPIYGIINNNLNIEHLWCKSWTDNKILINDMHNLYLANAELNAKRNDYGFSKIKYKKNNMMNDNMLLLSNKGKIIKNNDLDYDNIFYKKKYFNYCKVDLKKLKFEPPDESKGLIIRSLTYFLHQYPSLTIAKFESAISFKYYLKWFYKYKVTKEEIIRNEYIYFFQGNINPFVKYPILIPLLYDDNIYKNIKVIPNTLYSIIYSIYVRFILNIYYEKDNIIYNFYK